MYFQKYSSRQMNDLFFRREAVCALQNLQHFWYGPLASRMHILPYTVFLRCPLSTKSSFKNKSAILSHSEQIVNTNIQQHLYKLLPIKPHNTDFRQHTWNVYFLQVLKWMSSPCSDRLLNKNAILWILSMVKTL